MATIYLILVIILFVLAISDLVVGVSNDAVNFLNSAVGAKAANFKLIIFVAALGVLVGATFSSGMMEVARKGIFHPEYFYFSEIMILFLAVMVTDVILLDTFNTYGMPTSTTVSIVFELLGAAVAISTVKIFTDPNALELYEYINSAKAMAIISGILLSVIIAFTCGMIAQYISRLMFSFDYDKRIRRFGPIWGGLGIMAITYFMIIKGAKGSSLIGTDTLKMLAENTQLLLLYSFLAWTFILFILNRLFKVDILKVLVLIGTFALAMAFAGNDLVNFIGVPLAGYNSYQLYVEAGSTGADQMLMDGLAGKVPTPTLLLLIAGLIMVITLYISKKARSVLKTSIDLGRQEEGFERFSSFILSRKMVRFFSITSKFINNNLPSSVKNSITKQFDQTPFTRTQVKKGKDAPSFDMIRASVTLVIASILIAIGTNLKLPLSTTYVTFMVFMGTSLADGAWGKESAVYRVSGVLSVVGGWFFTAFSAFIAAFILAILFYFGGFIAIIVAIIIAVFVIYRTHTYHNKRMEKEMVEVKKLDEPITKAQLINLSINQLKSFLYQYSNLLDLSINGLKDEDLTSLNQAHKSMVTVFIRIKKLKNSSSNALDRVPDHELEAGHLYILIMDYLYEMGKNCLAITETNLNHIDNSHSTLLPEQLEELKSLQNMLRERYDLILECYKSLDETMLANLYENFSVFVTLARNVRKKQIKRIKNHEVKTRNSLVFLSHLGELRNLALFSNRIVKVFDEFVLNPSEDIPVVPATVKKELKKMKKEVKNILSDDSEQTQDNTETKVETKKEERGDKEKDKSE